MNKCKRKDGDPMEVCFNCMKLPGHSECVPPQKRNS
jgi:hypothetical protein